MYIDEVPNRNSPPAILLREGWREGNRVRKRTVANLSHWPRSQVEALRRVLKGETLVSVEEVFEVRGSLAHGHVEAVLGTLRRIELDRLISSRPSRERDLVVAMIVERLLHGSSKLASTRLWHTTTLAEELGVGDADEDDLYDAMLWLLARQKPIEKKLADRHLEQGGMVFYDLSSSYYYGRTCLLAKYGHSRDGKKGLPIIVYGLLADAEGRPCGFRGMVTTDSAIRLPRIPRHGDHRFRVMVTTFSGFSRNGWTAYRGMTGQHNAEWRGAALDNQGHTGPQKEVRWLNRGYRCANSKKSCGSGTS